MAIRISIHGTREGVSAQLDELKADGDTDARQIEAVKVVLKAEIASLPGQYNGVHVAAQGVANSLGRSLSYAVAPLNVHV